MQFLYLYYFNMHITHEVTIYTKFSLTIDDVEPTSKKFYTVEKELAEKTFSKM